MKNIFKNKKIQVAALAVICVMVLIPIWLFMETHTRREVTNIAPEEFFVREDILMIYQLGEVYRINNGDFEMAHLFVMEDGKVYYYSCEDSHVKINNLYSFCQSVLEGATYYQNSLLYLGRFSAIDLYQLKQYLSEVDCNAPTISCEKSMVHWDPSHVPELLTEVPEEMLTDFNRVIFESSSCYVMKRTEYQCEEYNALLQIGSAEENTLTQTTDPNAIAAMRMLLESEFFEEFLVIASEELYGERGAEYLEWYGR
ncbi:MAG: hypothetical protein IJZ00_04550 [Lachnospiraceae bacterium]|nr:hypothetical protein [Lachnospiraceae bacterium]